MARSKTSTTAKRSVKSTNRLTDKLPKKPSLRVKKNFLQKIFSLFIIFLVAGIALLIVDYGVQAIIARRDVNVMATVNGHKITRDELDARLEIIDGEAVLNELIQEEIIRDAAAEKGYEVPSQVIDERYKEIEDQVGGPDALKDIMQAEHFTEEFFREQLKNQELLAMLVKEQYTYTDEDLQKFFDEYKDKIPSLDPNKSMEEQRDEVVKQYELMKFAELSGPTLFELQTKADISTYTDRFTDREPKADYQPFKLTRQALSKLWDKIKD